MERGFHFRFTCLFEMFIEFRILLRNCTLCDILLIVSNINSVFWFQMAVFRYPF